MNDQEGEKRGNPCKGERRQLPRSKQQRRRLGTHIHDPGRDQEVGECGAEVQELVLMKDLRKKAWKDRREFEAKGRCTSKKEDHSKIRRAKARDQWTGQVRAERSGWRK